jgi:hypothetical protein
MLKLAKGTKVWSDGHYMALTEDVEVVIVPTPLAAQNCTSSQLQKNQGNPQQIGAASPNSALRNTTTQYGSDIGNQPVCGILGNSG